MADGPTFGVLANLTGGYYFGGILTGMTRAASRVGGRVVAIRLSDAGLDTTRPNELSLLQRKWAWQHVAGFAVVLNAVTRGYLESIRAAGKPVVMISTGAEGFPSPVIMADGRPGVRESVEHLLEHGHRRIAFAGCLGAEDVRLRYDTYCATLRAAGIEPDPRLLFEVDDHDEDSGEDAARRMLAAGLPSTAVLTGIDATAIGLMRWLAATGLRLPEDQAVVGFDDIVGTGCLLPRLSSVRQPFDMLGEAAVDLIMRELDGEPRATGRHYVDTSFVVRESCGCPPAGLIAPGIGLGATAPQQLSDSLVTALALGHRRDGDTLAVVARAADVITATITPVRPLAAASAGASGTTTTLTSATARPRPEDIDAALSALCRLNPRPESPMEVTARVREYADECLAAAPTEAARRAVEAASRQILVCLVGIQARHWHLETSDLQALSAMMYQISMDLLRGHEQNPRDLRWLRGTRWRGASLGVWLSDPDDPDVALLDVVSVFDQRDPHRPADQREPVPLEAFPPAQVLAMVEPGSGDIITLMPLRGKGSDWGLLALVGPPETGVPHGRELSNQSAALLTVALDHQALMQSLYEQESRLRWANLHDPLTDLPNRVHFQNRLEQALELGQADPTQDFAVCFLDLDRFKTVNDTLGHTVADHLLVQVAGRLLSSIRDSDLVARLAGDEFAVLVDARGDPNAAAKVVDRLQTAMREPFNVDGHRLDVSVSIGVAPSSVGYACAEDVLRDADKAMYDAKARGRDTHSVFIVAV
jgi:diguanylate cyclase (GGDEF)-like protein